MRWTEGVVKQGKYNSCDARDSIFRAVSRRWGMSGEAGSIPAPARFLQENRLRLVKMPGESVRAISREK